MIDPVMSLSLRWALGLLFAAAAWHKLRDLSGFVSSVRAYRLLPTRWVGRIAWVLSIAEASVALALFHAPAREAAALTALALIALYTFAIAANLALGRRDIDCGCFASSVKVPLSNWLLVRNAGLFLAALVVALPIRPRSLVWVDALTVVATLVTLSLLWAAGRRLAHTGPLLTRLGGTP